MKLHKHNLAVHRAASKEESRYVLRGIQVEPAGTIATDGHILAVVGLPKQEDETTVDERLIASDSCIDAERKASIKNPYITLNGDGILRADKGIAEAKPLEGKFPNWKLVMPRTAGFSVYFDPALLKRAGDLFERVGVQSVRMTFQAVSEPENSAIRLDAITNDGLPITAIVMPRHADKGKEMPLNEWPEAPKVETAKESK